MSFEIRREHPETPDVQALLHRHVALMQAQTPPESCHALPATALTADEIALFGLREFGVLLAVGALKLQDDVGEIKSMHTAQEARGKGAARALLNALMAHARDTGTKVLYLETGSGAEHAAARNLYFRSGFELCGPFGDYRADPLSVFMRRAL